MDNLHLNGLLKEIVARYPNIDLVDFLEDRLQLPIFKAEELASRIEKLYLLPKNPPRKTLRTILEKNIRIEASSQTPGYAIDSLSEKEFELFIKWLLQESGFRVEVESYPTASGIDLVANKDGERISVQARKYSRNLVVSDTIVLTAQSAKHIYECNKSIVIATTFFTKKAAIDAQSNGIELWGIDTLVDMINQVTKKVKSNSQSSFPPFNSSLLESIFKLGELKIFIIEPRPGEKYDLFLPGVKFPLLTFQINNKLVTGCVYRIKYNEPKSESEGEMLIRCENGVRSGPDGPQAYALIVEYLEQFIE